MPILEFAEKYNVNLALETDLAPLQFAELIEKLNSSTLKVCKNYF